MLIITADTWFKIVLVMEGAAALSCLGLLFGRAAWLRREALWLEPKTKAMRAILVQALETGAVTAHDLETVKRLPLRAQIKLIADLAASLTGMKLRELANIAKQLHIPQYAEALCRSPRWSRRVRGIRLLTTLAEGRHILPTLFQDPCPIVRSELANWAADHSSPELIDAVLRLLDDADGFCRFAAHNALYRMGSAVVGPLERYIESRTGIAQERAMAVAVSLGHEGFEELARKLLGHASPVTRTLAVEALGKAGSLQSAPLLIDRLNDPAPPVRQAAAHTLGRLKCWRAAPAIARLLQDPVWTVRHEAALTLRSLGAPGMLLLRRNLMNPDRFAGDMARHVLGLPAVTARAEPA